MYGAQAITYNTDLPWVLAILSYLTPREAKLCTGVLISSRWVATAAHCVTQLHSIAPLASDRLLVKVYHSEGNLTDYGVKDVYVHPEYAIKDGVAVKNDMGLLRTKEVVPVSPCPVEAEAWVQPKSLCILAGFGQTSLGSKYMHVPILHYLVRGLMCHEGCMMFSTDGQEVLCFLVQGGTGPCLGDSGSPLLCDGKVVGILSRGAPFSGPVFCSPSTTAVIVYERITNYNHWIKQVMSDARPQAPPALNYLLFIVVLWHYFS